MFGRKKTAPFAERDLAEVLARVPAFAGLRGNAEFARAADEFGRTKEFSGEGGMVLTPQVIATVSALSVLPLWRLGLEWADDWHGVVVVPDEFAAPVREETRLSGDEFGGGMTVVHEGVEERAGEAMEHGPITLSWVDVLESGWLSGFNVAVHEVAHKLDMRNGDGANGFPPLPSAISAPKWTDAMERAFADLERRVESDEDAPVEECALDDAGEFFAVCAESFFDTPNLLRAEWPDVYGMLSAFFLQDPAERLPE